jgi:hypothetical protein
VAEQPQRDGSVRAVTDAVMDAAARAMDAAFSGAERRPFHELVREEQRKRLTVVGDTPTEPVNEPMPTLLIYLCRT